MLVFWKERTVILSVPKTGTSALESAIGNAADARISEPAILKHAPLYRYQRYLKPFFEDVGGQSLETVAVIRDPVDWLGSWYRYRGRPFLDGHPNSTAKISFDEFVLAYMKGQKPGFANVGSQAKFVSARAGHPEITHLFRYEQPRYFLEFLEDRLGRSVDLPRTNVSPQRDVTLSAEIEERLRIKCAAEFETWERARRG